MSDSTILAERAEQLQRQQRTKLRWYLGTLTAALVSGALTTVVAAGLGGALLRGDGAGAVASVSVEPQAATAMIPQPTQTPTVPLTSATTATTSHLGSTTHKRTKKRTSTARTKTRTALRSRTKTAGTSATVTSPVVTSTASAS